MIFARWWSGISANLNNVFVLSMILDSLLVEQPGTRNWAIVVLFDLSIFSTFSKLFHPRGQWGLWCTNMCSIFTTSLQREIIIPSWNSLQVWCIDWGGRCHILSKMEIHHGPKSSPMFPKLSKMRSLYFDFNWMTLWLILGNFTSGFRESFWTTLEVIFDNFGNYPFGISEVILGYFGNYCAFGILGVTLGNFRDGGDWCFENFDNSS